MMNLIQKEDVDFCEYLHYDQLITDVMISNFTCLSIAPASIFMSPARGEAVSFSFELDFGTIGIFIKNPDNVYNLTAYLAPLTYWSWVSISLFLLLFSIVLFTMARLVKEPFKISILESFETVTFAFLLTDSPFKPSCLTMRILLVRYDYT